MSDRKPDGKPVDSIPQEAIPWLVSINLPYQDGFVTGLGVDWSHYRAMPSPIGLKDKGDYRRPDGLDTISSNGFIYEKAGIFTGVISDNSKSQKRSDSGLLDASTSRIIMPRHYNKDGGLSNGDQIRLAPGDRIYMSDPNADDAVPNYQRMTYDPNKDNETMFPVVKMESMVDSRGVRFQEGRDYKITCDGWIRWIPGGENPGVDPDTGAGRVYSVRYLYKSFWYVVSIPKEVRITNVTENGVRSPQRMASHAVVQREYIYHNQINAGNETALKPQDQKRIVPTAPENIDPNSTQIHVEMTDIEQES